MRHLTRFVHQTLCDVVYETLDATGWVDEPVNFDARVVTVQELEPRKPEKIEPNLVAVTLDFPSSAVEAELGDGLRMRSYQVFIDVFAENWSTAMAIADDLYDRLVPSRTPVRDYQNGAVDTAIMIEIDEMDLDEPPAAGQVDRSTWRVLTGSADVYYLED